MRACVCVCLHGLPACLYIYIYIYIYIYLCTLIFIQKELETLQALHNIDSVKLKDVEEHFAEVKEAYLAITKNQRLKTEELSRQKKELDERVKCSTKIQAIWRGHLQRTGFTQKKTKKENKKGGKKKGGKKNK